MTQNLNNGTYGYGQCIEKNAEIGSIKIKYSGVQFRCQIEDKLYIGCSGTRVDEPIIHRIIHGVKKVFTKYFKETVSYLVNISSEDTSEYTITAIVDNRKKYDEAELQTIKELFLDVAFTAYQTFFSILEQTNDCTAAEKATYEFICNAIMGERYFIVHQHRLQRRREKKARKEYKKLKQMLDTPMDGPTQIVAQEVSNCEAKEDLAQKLLYLHTVTNNIATTLA